LAIWDANLLASCSPKLQQGGSISFVFSSFNFIFFEGGRDRAEAHHFSSFLLANEKERA
jgi:hypothetical protein